MPALEEAIRRVRLDKETLAPFHESEPDRTVDRTAEPGDPEIVIGHSQAEDPVVPHAVVLGQDDLDRVTAQLQLSAQTEHHLAQTARLGDWCAFGCDHDDEQFRRLTFAPSRARAGRDGRSVLLAGADTSRGSVPSPAAHRSSTVVAPAKS